MRQRALAAPIYAPEGGPLSLTPDEGRLPRWIRPAGEKKVKSLRKKIQCAWTPSWYCGDERPNRNSEPEPVGVDPLTAQSRGRSSLLVVATTGTLSQNRSCHSPVGSLPVNEW